jgi:lipopolysaccharide export system protein LptA
MKRLKLNAVLLSTLVLSSIAANASLADFDKPIAINSNNQSIDLKNDVSIFKQNVSVVQGSLSIKADFMKVYRRNSKGNELFEATGNPVIYEQILDGNQLISAQADKIRYDVATKILTLTGNARLTQNDSLVQGEIITFDLIKEQLNAQGGVGQTQTILHPQQDDKGEVTP